MATLTATDTIDVLVIAIGSSTNERVYEEQITSHIAEDENLLQSWVEDWADGFIHPTENPDQHTATLTIFVINPDKRETLYADNIEVAATVV